VCEVITVKVSVEVSDGEVALLRGGMLPRANGESGEVVSVLDWAFAIDILGWAINKLVDILFHVLGARGLLEVGQDQSANGSAHDGAHDRLKAEHTALALKRRGGTFLSINVLLAATGNAHDAVDNVSGGEARTTRGI